MELSLWCLRLIPACFECTSHSFFYKQKLSWLVTKWWGLILPMYLGNANTYTFETVSLYRGVGTGVYVTPVLWLTFFFFLNKLHCPREMFPQIQFTRNYSFKDTWLVGPPTKRLDELCPPHEAWGLHVMTSLSVASTLTGVHQHLPSKTSVRHLKGSQFA